MGCQRQRAKLIKSLEEEKKAESLHSSSPDDETQSSPPAGDVMEISHQVGFRSSSRWN